MGLVFGKTELIRARGKYTVQDVLAPTPPSLLSSASLVLSLSCQPLPAMRPSQPPPSPAERRCGCCSCSCATRRRTRTRLRGLLAVRMPLAEPADSPRVLAGSPPCSASSCPRHSSPTARRCRRRPTARDSVTGLPVHLPHVNGRARRPLRRAVVGSRWPSALGARCQSLPARTPRRSLERGLA